MLNYKVKVLDIFLIKRIFLIYLIIKNLVTEEKLKVYHNKINKNNQIIESSIDEQILKRLNTNYFSQAFDILRELNREKLNLISYSDFTIIKTNKNTKFPIHDDTPDKLLSGVIYLYPERNKGTIFYKKIR